MPEGRAEPAPFPGCTVVVWGGLSAAAAAAWAAKLVAPGGTVRLVGAVAPDWSIFEPWVGLLAQMEAMDAELGARAEALAAEGCLVTTATVLPGELDDAETLLGEERALVVFADRPLRDRRTASLAWWALRSGVSITWPSAGAPADIRHVLVPFALHTRNAAPVVALLRRWGEPQRVTFLRLGLQSTSSALPGEDLARILGWAGEVALDGISLPPTQILGALADYTRQHAVDAVVLSSADSGELGSEGLMRLVAAALQGVPAPVLVVAGPGWVGFVPELDAPDILDCGERLHLRVDHVNLLGQSSPATDPAVALVSDGQQIAIVALQEGWGMVDPAPLPPAVGLMPADGEPFGLEATLRVHRPGRRRVGLFDAELDPDWIGAPEPEGRLWLGVRLGDAPPFRATRRRLARQGADGLLDAGSVIAEGPGSDVPALASPVRLARVARHLRARGVAVDVVVGGTAGHGFATPPPEVLRQGGPEALEALVAEHWRDPAAPEPVASRARSLRVLFDNKEARLGLLQQIASARHRIHLQTYIWQRDAFGAALAEAVAEAAGRGVTVRILVDSLYGMTGSLGLRNRLLDELEALDNVRVLRIRPVRRIGLVDLKCRNHRKLLVIDGRAGRLTGRNVGKNYYTGYDEVAIGPGSVLNDIPWLDTSVEVEGGIVRELDAAFLRDWTREGGDGFELLDPGPEGDVPVRLILHDGLEDADTLDAFRALIDGARRHLYVLNSFPLLFELQHALLDALERGVDVRFLLGNVRPVYGARTPFPGAEGPARELINNLVHGRIDPLIRAGARVWEYAVREVPGWDPALGDVRPHVHAKLLSVDGERFAAGSANLDVTAGYWESEALLVVEHPEHAARVEAGLDRLIASSIPIDPGDPGWQHRAQRRAWLARNWPTIVV